MRQYKRPMDDDEVAAWIAGLLWGIAGTTLVYSLLLYWVC
jgi:hypothetical protein